MSTDSILIKISSWVWNRLRESRKHKYQLGEESITDFLILSLKKYTGSEIKVNSFTRHEEGINGADWECWFTGSSGKWLGIRVQAKVLNLKSQCYEHLHYKNKSNTKQVDLLIEDSKKNKMVPIYCMYTNWNPSQYKTPDICKRYKASVRHYGVSLLSVNYVKKQDSKTNLFKIISYLRPLHCILCCNKSKDLPSRVLHNLEEIGMIEILSDSENKSECMSKSDDDYGLSSFLQNTPPIYVTKMLNGNLKDESHDFFDSRLKTITIFSNIN